MRRMSNPAMFAALTIAAVAPRGLAGDRPIDRGESTMFGSDPFAGTTTERPTGMIPAGRSP